MSRRWPLAVAAALAVVAFGSLARIDVDAPADLDGLAPTPPSTDEPEGGWPTTGTWQPIANSPGGTRAAHTTLWTGTCPEGTEPPSCGALLVWGGRMVVGPRSDGMAYHPSTDTWRRIPPAPRAPLEWGTVPGAWTGAELVVWAATDGDFADNAGQGGPSGAAYDPVADTWRTLPEAPLEPRFGHTLTWTGSEVVVWGGRRAGGQGRGEPLGDGAAYDPDADTWRVLADAPLGPRRDHTAVWLEGAGRLAVWGGLARQDGEWTPTVDGAMYDSAADEWEPLSSPVVTTPRHARAWEPAATRLEAPERLAIVAPLVNPDTLELVVAVYEPGAGLWELVPAGPVGLRGDATVGGDDRIVAWGGAVPGPAPAGAISSPGIGAWQVAPGGREAAPGETATWTDAGLLTWGGGREGAVWDPEGPPDAEPRHAVPHGPGETREVELPTGHETGWLLAASAGDPPPSLEVRGDASEVTVWLEARSQRGWRMRRLQPMAVDCDAERCVHRFDPLPERLPGPVEVRLRNEADEALTLAVTPGNRE